LGSAAELDDGTPIPVTVLAQIACDSEISRIVFGPGGEPLDVGRAQRTYTGPQRRAVIARDRHCQYPGCGAPPTIGEVHHVRWWIRDHGPTSVDNGILLCAFHHHTIHKRAISITRQPGGWEFRDQSGRLIQAGGAPPPETDTRGEAELGLQPALPARLTDVGEAPLRSAAEHLCLAV
jgi:hypothetical protein